ncbi:MAG: ZIP family metal transporter [Candidatus Micrarchaeia archaeon]|jgi:zinc and cadmium transporter
MVLFEIIAATVAVSLLSLVGIVLFLFAKKKMEGILFFLVSFSAGTLLGAAFFDLLPEAVEGAAHPEGALELAFAGLVLAFFLEKVVHWHHHHAGSEKEHHRPLGMLTLAGDAVHNFFDGVAIAAAFMVNVPLGVTTTLAIALHEIPQEIGDFGLLLYSGYSRAKALAFNLLSALAAVVGGVAFYLFSSSVENVEAYALALTAGMFIYIASADLLPELHKEKRARESLLQLALIVLGAAAIWLIARTMHG